MVNYLETVEKFDHALKHKLVVVDFTATWCGPCKRIAPDFEKLGADNKDIIIYKVDVDEHSEVAEKNGISAMPTFKFFKNGTELADQQVQGASLPMLQKAIAENK